MEDKLKAIIKRIEASSLQEEEKVQLYAVISESLKASIWPTLVSAMPKEALETLTQAPGKATVEAYLSLIEEATKDEKVLDDINQVTNDLVSEIDAALKEEHI